MMSLPLLVVMMAVGLFSSVSGKEQTAVRDVPLTYYIGSLSTQKMHNHVKQSFGILLKKKDAEVTIESPDVDCVFSCFSLLSRDDKEVKKGQNFTFKKREDEPCVPLINAVLVKNASEGPFKVSIHYNDDDCETLNEFTDNVETSQNGQLVGVWWRQVPGTPYSLYNGARMQVLLRPDDFNAADQDVENFLYFANRVEVIMRSYSCLADHADCGFWPTLYGTMSNHKFFYKATCQYMPVENFDTFSDNTTVKDSTKSLGYTNASRHGVMRDCGYPNVAAYYSYNHLAVIGESSYKFLESNWMMFHETGHGFDEGLSDDYFSLAEVSVNLFSMAYESRYNLSSHWIQGEKWEYDKMRNDYREGKLDVRDLRTALNVVYAITSFGSMTLRNINRYIYSHPEYSLTKHGILQAYLHAGQRVTDRTALPFIWNMFPRYSAKQMQFASILDRYYAGDKLYRALYPCFYLDSQTGQKLGNQVPHYAYETYKDKLSAFQLCHVKSRPSKTSISVSVSKCDAKATYRASDATGRCAADAEHKNEVFFELNSVFTPIWSFGTDIIVHPQLFMLLESPSNNNPTFDLKPVETNLKTSVVHLDEIQALGIGDGKSLVLRLSREGPKHTLSVSLLKNAPHPYFPQSWCNVSVTDNGKVIYSRNIKGADETPFQEVLDISVDQAVITIQAAELHRIEINKLRPVSDTTKGTLTLFNTNGYLQTKPDFKIYSQLAKDYWNFPDIHYLRNTFPYVKMYGDFLDEHK